MSLFSRINVLFWNNVRRGRYYYKTKYKIVHRYTPIKLLPTTVSFSIFTWLGFDKKPSTEDEIIMSIKYSVLYIQRNEYDKAERLLHVTLRQAQQIHHEQAVTYIYDVLANLALQREQLNKAKSLFVSVTQRLLANGVDENDLKIIHLSAKLARVSHLKKEYDVAQIGYDWCFEKLKKLSVSTPEIAQLYAMVEDWCGRLQIDCNHNEEGLNLMISSLNRMKEIDDFQQEHLVVQLNDIGTIYERVNNFDKSIEYFNEAIALAKELKLIDELAAIYVNIGKVYMRKNMFELARKHCGRGWRMGIDQKNEEVTKEANLCLKEVNELSS